MIAFPDVVARSESWTVQGAAVESGRPLIGSTPQRAVFGGGGLVVVRKSGVRLRTPAQIGEWQAAAVMIDNGAIPMLVTSRERSSSPRLPTGLAPVAATIGAAARRATSLSLAVTGGRSLRLGDAFSINHPIAGWRFYRIGAIASAAPAGGGATAYELTIRPPLRQAVADGTAVDFDRRRCVMRIAEADGMDLDVELNRFANVSVSFVEDFTALEALP